MRNFLIATAIGAAFLLSIPSCSAGDVIKATPVVVASLSGAQAAAGGNALMQKFRTPNRVAFCGQCTKNSDCGTCRCTGPSDGSCNQCSCP